MTVSLNLLRIIFLETAAINSPYSSLETKRHVKESTIEAVQTHKTSTESQRRGLLFSLMAKVLGMRCIEWDHKTQRLRQPFRQLAGEPDSWDRRGHVS